MENWKGISFSKEWNGQVEENNLSVNKDLSRMKQEIMLKRLANYHEVNPVFQKINKFFSLFF